MRDSKRWDGAQKCVAFPSALLKTGISKLCKMRTSAHFSLRLQCQSAGNARLSWRHSRKFAKSAEKVLAISVIMRYNKEVICEKQTKLQKLNQNDCNILPAGRAGSFYRTTNPCPTIVSVFCLPVLFGRRRAFLRADGHLSVFLLVKKGQSLLHSIFKSKQNMQEEKSWKKSFI